MPVLDNALLACAIAFTPLLVWLTFGAPIANACGRVVRLVPRRFGPLADSVLDWLSQDARPSSAVLQGLFLDRIAPPRAERARMETPALVIGHSRDPIHPFSDADMLVRELPNGRLVQANSILELRLAPARLTDEIARFIDECWTAEVATTDRAPRRARGGRRASAG
jgi:pimeloyl-ACP methyl ester carboxylesterase